MKKQINKQQLLACAELWFTKRHGESPDDCGVNFIKIWNKPEIFRKTLCVVFAPTEEIGKAFIWEQNVILRTIKNFVFFIFFFIVAIFSLFSQIGPPRKAIDNRRNNHRFANLRSFCIHLSGQKMQEV